MSEKGKPSYTRLVIALQNTVRELERLHYLHKDKLDGKVGCPDEVIIKISKQLIDEAYNG